MCHPPIGKISSFELPDTQMHHSLSALLAAVVHALSFLEDSGSSLTSSCHDQGQLQHSSSLQNSLTFTTSLPFIYTPWQLSTNSERPRMGKTNQRRYVAKGGRPRIHGKTLKTKLSAVNQEELPDTAIPCWERVLCLLPTEGVCQKSLM